MSAAAVRKERTPYNNSDNATVPQSQVAVVYTRFLQQAFSTVSLSLSDWLVCVGVASSVLWLRELSKLLWRWTVSAKQQ